MIKLPLTGFFGDQAWDWETLQMHANFFRCLVCNDLTFVSSFLFLTSLFYLFVVLALTMVILVNRSNVWTGLQ